MNRFPISSNKEFSLSLTHAVQYQLQLLMRTFTRYFMHGQHCNERTDAMLLKTILLCIYVNCFGRVFIL